MRVRPVQNALLIPFNDFLDDGYCYETLNSFSADFYVHLSQLRAGYDLA